MRSRQFNKQHIPRCYGKVMLALLMLAGCSSTPVQPKPDTVKVKQFSGRGYLTDSRYNIVTSTASWAMGDASYDVALTLPEKQGSFPLIIYLPGLGENRSAGQAWRSAWAQGGYAVLTVQPLLADADAWSSTQALSGDFSALAHDRYSVASMAKRLDALRQIMDELLRRKALKEPPLDRVDTSHAAIVGYDLGAYTVMVTAGESLRGLVKQALPIPVSACIALSPYASFSGTALSQRYSIIHGPVLSITSDDDSDALGVVTSPSLRRAPFEYMPEGNKFLLTMAGVPHEMIGGNKEEIPEGDKKPAHGVEGKGKAHHGKHKGKDGDGSGAGSESEVSSTTSYLSPTEQALNRVAIQQVTVAFLDAFTKNDAIAREWLEKDAPRWLGQRGELKAR